MTSGHLHGASDAPAATIRVALELASRRLRRVIAQAGTLDDAHLLLDFFRNLKYVHASDPKLLVSIPLVFIERWVSNGTGSPERGTGISNFASSKRSRSQYQEAEQELDRHLCEAIFRRFDHDPRGLLLDLVHDIDGARQTRADATAISSAHARSLGPGTNEHAQRPRVARYHPLLGPTAEKVELPSALARVEAFVRLAFPLLPPVDGCRQMATIILGVGFERQSGRLSDAALGHLQAIGESLIDQVPATYRALRDMVGTRKSAIVGSGGSLAAPEDRRDVLGGAIDRLHEDIAMLAEREGLSGWFEPENGYNFAIAFRELTRDHYESRLKFRLTHFNERALAAGMHPNGKLTRWIETPAERENLVQLMTRVFARNREPAPERQAREYVDGAAAEMRDLLSKRAPADWWRALKDKIEDSPYPTHLTPGYAVMALNSPTVIEDWLMDPRARGQFRDYPRLLLGWESVALPKEIYYSPIADGGVCFAVCGTEAALLRKPGGHLVQELIDESGLLCRRRILDGLFDELLHDLWAARKQEITGRNLCHRIIWHFRRIAYYYLSETDDYHTKLVADSDLAALDAWETFKHDGWKRWKGQIDHEVARKLIDARQYMPSDERGTVRDYVGDYLKPEPRLDEAELHRISMKGAPGYSLLILVPLRRDQTMAHELLLRFCGTCSAGLADYVADAGWERDLSKTGKKLILDAAARLESDSDFQHDVGEGSKFAFLNVLLPGREQKEFAALIRPRSGLYNPLQSGSQRPYFLPPKDPQKSRERDALVTRRVLYGLRQLWDDHAPPNLRGSSECYDIWWEVLVAGYDWYVDEIDTVGRVVAALRSGDLLAERTQDAIEGDLRIDLADRWFQGQDDPVTTARFKGNYGGTVTPTGEYAVRFLDGKLYFDQAKQIDKPQKEDGRRWYPRYGYIIKIRGDRPLGSNASVDAWNDFWQLPDRSVESRRNGHVTAVSQLCTKSGFGEAPRMLKFNRPMSPEVAWWQRMNQDLLDARLFDRIPSETLFDPRKLKTWREEAAHT